MVRVVQSLAPGSWICLSTEQLNWCHAVADARRAAGLAHHGGSDPLKFSNRSAEDIEAQGVICEAGFNLMLGNDLETSVGATTHVQSAVHGTDQFDTPPIGVDGRRVDIKSCYYVPQNMWVKRNKFLLQDGTFNPTTRGADYFGMTTLQCNPDGSIPRVGPCKVTFHGCMDKMSVINGNFTSTFKGMQQYEVPLSSLRPLSIVMVDEAAASSSS